MSFDLNLLIKFLTWLASPLGAFSFGALLSLILLVAHRAAKFRVWLMLLVSLQLCFFAIPGVAGWLHRGLEYQSQELVAHRPLNQNYVGALLLGGVGTPFTASDVGDFGKADFRDSVDRVLHSARLYHAGTVPLIIITGGNWRSDESERPSEASSIRDLLIELGVPAEKIIIEERSRTTRENFLYTSALLKQHDLEGPLALVTSASHIPRAMRNAQAFNVQADPFPTDWRSRALMLQPFTWLPNADALEQSELAIKEWLAWLVNY